MTRFHADRRAVLRGALLALGAAGLPPLALSACGAGGGANVAVSEIGDGVWVLSGAPGNVVARRTAQGLVVVDAGSAAAGKAVASALAGLGAGRVHTLINTHYHADQTGGNEAVGKGARIFAHAVTRQWLANPYYVPKEDRWEPARPKAAWPTEVFYQGTGALDAGGEAVDYGHLVAAHTAGDAYVFFRGPNVLVAGGVVSPAQDPEIDWWAGGWLGGLADAHAQLAALADDGTKIVPAYGPVMTKAELQGQADMMKALYEKLNTMIRKGQAYTDMLEAKALDDTGRTWNDPSKFLYDASKSLWAHMMSLSNDIV